MGGSRKGKAFPHTKESGNQLEDWSLHTCVRKYFNQS